MSSYNGVRRQGDTKERQTKPDRPKTPCLSQFQTRKMAVDRALKTIQKVAPSRVMRISPEKVIVQPWTREELVAVLDKGNIIRSNSELAGSDQHKVYRQCITELSSQGALVENPPGLYKLAPDLMTQVS